MIIAVDGPAAAGKGTLARRLADRFNLAYLDTGTLYRAVGLRVLQQRGDPGDAATALSAATALQAEELTSPALRDEATAAAASKVAAFPDVRSQLLAFQRDFAHNAADGGKSGAVIDGRDIGTVVCPDADVKLFVTASDEVRAHRRFLEAQANDPSVTEAEVLAEIRQRDARDSNRDASPLVMAEDAHLLDTSNLDIESVFQLAVAHIEEVQRRSLDQ